MLKPNRKSERKPATPPARRGRPGNVQSYADWAARIDAQVDEMVRTMPRETPSAPSRPPSSLEGRLLWALSEVHEIEHRLWTMLQKERYAKVATRDTKDDG